MQEVTNRKNEALQPAVPDTDQRLVQPRTTEPRHKNQGLGRWQVVGGMLLNTQSLAGQSHGSFPTHPYPQVGRLQPFLKQGLVILEKVFASGKTVIWLQSFGEGMVRYCDEKPF